MGIPWRAPERDAILLASCHFWEPRAYHRKIIFLFPMPPKDAAVALGDFCGDTKKARDAGFIAGAVFFQGRSNQFCQKDFLERG